MREVRSLSSPGAVECRNEWPPPAVEAWNSNRDERPGADRSVLRLTISDADDVVGHHAPFLTMSAEEVRRRGGQCAHPDGETRARPRVVVDAGN